MHKIFYAEVLGKSTTGSERILGEFKGRKKERSLLIHARDKMVKKEGRMNRSE